VRWRAGVSHRGHGHLPGCDRRLYLKLYGPRDLQDAVLARLPRLTARLGGGESWFIRYEDPEPHLRLRITLGTGGIGAAAGHVGAWTSELRDHGLVTQVSWDTYYPETARFGGEAAMGAAEEFFAADSAAAVAQGTAAARKNGPDLRVLTAASMTDIVRGATGSDAEAMRWLTGHTRTGPVPPPRPVYHQAVALICAPRTAGKLGADIERAWTARRAALAVYRDALRRTGIVSLTDLLPDLLHLHHARVTGPDLEAERACLHLARAAAQSWLARAGRAS
jgi:thiopeptide-type bacteriocin biosynthesis protein